MQGNRSVEGHSNQTALMTLDLRALLRALAEADVRYIAVGGVAVAAHGYVRATEDLDLVPDPDPENLRRLANVLVSLDAHLPLAAGRPLAAWDLLPGRNLTLDTPRGGVDIVQRAAGVPSFSELDRSAVASDVEGIPVRICSLGHLRAMKEAAGRAIDRVDLERLPPASAREWPG